MKQFFEFLPLLLVLSCTKNNQNSADSNSNSNSTIQVLTPPRNVYSYSNYFNSICIDNNNNKWVSSENGLLKFDGSNWTIYSSSNTAITFGGSTSFLQSDNQGWIYAITIVNGNLNIVTNANNIWNSYPLPFEVVKFTIDKPTNSFYFTDGNSLYKYNGSGSFSGISNYSDLGVDVPQGSQFTDLFVYDSTFYLCYTRGVYNSGIVIKTGNGTPQYYASSNSDVEFSKIITNDGSNVLTFASEGSVLQKLNLFNNGNWTAIPYDSANEQVNVLFKLEFSKDGSMWICDGDLGKYANQAFTFYSIDSEIVDVAIDNNNVKWMASLDKGLIKFTAQ